MTLIIGSGGMPDDCSRSNNLAIADGFHIEVFCGI